MADTITCVLFDLDGTIADTNEVILRTIEETLERATGRSWHRAELLTHWGLRLRDQLVALCPEIDLEQAVPFYRRRYAEHHRALLTEFSGMREVLASLSAVGVRLGVVTSKKRESAHATLESLGYATFFEVVVAEEETARHKPAPDPLLLALERMNLPASAALYVGDNPDDVTAAHAAGMRAVAVRWSLRPVAELEAARPEEIIGMPADLLHWVRGREAKAGVS